MGYPLHRDESGVAASPSFPVLEHEVLDYWATHDHLPPPLDRAAAEGCDEWVFFNERPAVRRTACPKYRHRG